MNAKPMMFMLLLLAFGCRESDLVFPLPNRCGAQGVATYESTAFRLFSSSPGSLSGGEINSFFDWGTRRFWLVSNAQLNTDNGLVSIGNCLLLQDNSSVQVIASQGDSGPGPLLPDPDGRHFFTINQGQVVDDQLELLVSKWRRTGEGRSAEPESSWVFVLSLTDWRVVDSKQMAIASDQVVGAALLRHEGYTYVYMTREIFWNRECSIARVTGSFLNSWEFFDGTAWQTSSAFLRPVTDNVGLYFSVFRQGDEFQMISFGALLSAEIRLQRAHSPEDGWRPVKVLYCESDGGEEYYSVNALMVAHSAGSLTTVYSRVDRDFGTIRSGAPRFLEINGWDF